MATPQNQTMRDEPDEFRPLLGLGKGGGAKFLDPLSKDNWPWVGKQETQCLRCRCFCLDGGCSGDVIPSRLSPGNGLICQVCCFRLKAPDIPKQVGFSLVTTLPILEDKNFCHNHFICTDGGCVKLDTKIQLLCLQINL